jgi:hypothetical protein
VSLVAVGAAAGSWLDDRRAPEPARAGDYVVLAADFHVHAFPGDGALPPNELSREATRRGLHAIVVSNHNQTLAARMMSRPFADALPVIIPSQEVTTPRFHLIAAGISQTVDWRKPELEIVSDVHAQGGVVIAAHPVRRYWRADENMLAAIDGAEIAHPIAGDGMGANARVELHAFFDRAQAVNPTLAPIGSSDFHMISPIGICRTHVFADSVTVQGVLDAVRAGRTVAEDQYGALYGDEQLKSALQQSGAVTPRPGPAGTATFSALMVLLGLLGMIVLR